MKSLLSLRLLSSKPTTPPPPPPPPLLLRPAPTLRSHLHPVLLLGIRLRIRLQQHPVRPTHHPLRSQTPNSDLGQQALLEAALERGEEEEEEDGEEEVVKEEDQKSVALGIIGAPNAGKSALTNYLGAVRDSVRVNRVGRRVLRDYRKQKDFKRNRSFLVEEGRNRIRECFFDTLGLSVNTHGIPYKDFKARVESAWSSVNLYDVLIVIFDVHRHLTRPDVRVIKTIKRMGMEPHPTQKRVLCMNKVDLVEKKKDLLTVAEQFKDLPGYDRHFMISGLKGYGVKDLTEYLMLQACLLCHLSGCYLGIYVQAVKRPWEEDSFTMSDEVLKNISLEVVRENFLDHIHQEIPYDIDHRLIDWKELRDGSIRIEQHFITHKPSQRKILVGKRGAKIGRIGIEANEELRSIFKRDVHLFLQVRLK
ncbi:hypothetical protein ACLB2K_032538 [Fragaria x ananassa]